MSQTVLSHALELAWRHWTVVGVRGTAPAPRYPVDIEALIAFTPHVIAEDPRLRDESRDWCARIGREYVSLSRLRQVQKTIGPPDAARTEQLALFEGGGFEGVTGKSASPALEHPALLQLRARALFGVSTRADVLGVLAIMSGETRRLTATQLRPSGCTKQAVAAVLQDLVRGNLLRRVEGPTGVVFEIVRGEALRSLLDPVPYVAVDWAERFALVAIVLRTWARYGTRATYGVELMKTLRPAIAAVRRPLAPLDLRGRPQQVASRVERWALQLLDDEAWEESWMVAGEDVSHDILARIYEDIVARVQSGDYPVGFTELESLTFRRIDRRGGTAQFSLTFDGEHPREDFSFSGSVEGGLAFDPTARRKDAFLDSVTVEHADVHFALDDPD